MVKKKLFRDLQLSLLVHATTALQMSMPDRCECHQWWFPRPADFRPDRATSSPCLEWRVHPEPSDEAHECGHDDADDEVSPLPRALLCLNTISQSNHIKSINQSAFYRHSIVVRMLFSANKLSLSYDRLTAGWNDNIVDIASAFSQLTRPTQPSIPLESLALYL